MAAVGVEEDPAVQAARILLSLRHRRLVRPPEWAPLVPKKWPKGQRSVRERPPGDWKEAWAALKLGYVAASTGSGAWSSGEDGERSPSPPRAMERPRVRPTSGDALMTTPARRQETPLHYGAPARSGQSTSAADRAARPRDAGEKVAAQQAAKVSAAAPIKEPMTASSPETPLDFGVTAAGSNASSSGDDAARPPPKRRAPGARGSGGTSNGDEGCSSPAKRTRVAGAGAGGKAAAAVEERAISVEPNVQSEPSTNGHECVKFQFDLNIPWTDDCPDIC
ncbi:uncharacterized protein LOC133895431 [Phragmites australis]|uniref:uncharacterized protein LOC133895431 n=1 Tax=Phragmites australis TaxID=29695 RepID=UPI002D777AD9|nr:uncharacterized protein LOC133895431 [Phragmites australis]